MSTVTITGELPIMGADAERIVLNEARPVVGRVVDILEREVESRGPAGGPADLFTEVDFSGEELVGRAVALDFRFALFERGTGERFEGKPGSGVSGGRGKAFGPRRLGPSDRNPKHRRALRTPQGFRARVKGVRARHMFREGYAAAQPRIEAEFRSLPDAVTPKLIRR